MEIVLPSPAQLVISFTSSFHLFLHQLLSRIPICQLGMFLLQATEKNDKKSESLFFLNKQSVEVTSFAIKKKKSG